MLDIIEYEGQPALVINDAIIGTEQEIITHLRKSEKCDILMEELLFFKGGVSQ